MFWKNLKGRYHKPDWTLSLTHFFLCFFDVYLSMSVMVWVFSFVISFLFLIVYLHVSCLLSTSSLCLFSQNIFSFSSSCSCPHKVHTVSRKCKKVDVYIVMTERLKLWPVWSAKERNTYTCMCRRAFICHREVCYSVKWAVIHQLPVKCLSALSAWCISAWHTVTYVAYLLPSRGLWVRGARKAYCKIRRSRKSWYFFCISQTSWWNILNLFLAYIK